MKLIPLIAVQDN